MAQSVATMNSMSKLTLKLKEVTVIIDELLNWSDSSSSMRRTLIESITYSAELRKNSREVERPS